MCSRLLLRIQCTEEDLAISLNLVHGHLGLLHANFLTTAPRKTILSDTDVEEEVAVSRMGDTGNPVMSSFLMMLVSWYTAKCMAKNNSLRYFSMQLGKLTVVSNKVSSFTLIDGFTIYLMLAMSRCVPFTFTSFIA